MTYHSENSATVPATADQVFAYLDDHTRLSSHMSGSSWFMGERDPPYRKSWETIGAPRLLVIAQYRMGFVLRPRGRHTELRVFIDYELPHGPVSRWLGRLFGAFYARWCTRRMVADAAQHFGSAARDAHA